jgi:vacuolar protein sorting-associated protein IST1
MRDLFEKKYGKDFVAAAVDLRPNASVNNLVSLCILFLFKVIHCHGCMCFLLTRGIDVLLKLIEKLSVNKPSGQTKLKVLKDIAKEHQIDWDTTETEQDLLKPPEELIVRATRTLLRTLFIHMLYALT